jgi:hypothetical protein
MSATISTPTVSSSSSPSSAQKPLSASQKPPLSPKTFQAADAVTVTKPLAMPALFQLKTASASYGKGFPYHVCVRARVRVRLGIGWAVGC